MSSSGHLVLGRELLGVSEPDLFFDIIVHVATLVVTLIIYARPVAAMTSELIAGANEVARGRGLAEMLAARPEAKLSLLIVAGTVPTGVIGVVFKDLLEALFDIPVAASAMLLVTAALLIATRFTRADGRTDAAMTVRDALLIGLVQGFAIIPGISRSGSTIAAALLLGLDRELAARFSFLLSVPAILGALVLKLRDLEAGIAVSGTALGVGFAAALVTGFLALVALLPLVRRGQLHWFALYLVPVSITGVILAG